MRVPKWPFVFLQQNANFYSCTQSAIRYFTAKYEILQLYSNGYSFFYSEMRNFETLPKQPFRFIKTKHKILKTSPKRPFVFYNEIQNLKVVPKRPFAFFINFFQVSFLKNGKKNIDYRILVPGLYNGFLKPVVYCRKNHCKRVSPRFFSVLYTNITIF